MSDTEFFGRIGEMETLQDAYESATAEMAILYGRRRIGKTALIRKFCEGKPVFFYTARAWKDPFQLDEFSQAVGAFCGNPQQRFLNWPAAFRALADQTCDARKVIVIDEFQYIAKARPSFQSELQVLWDEELSRKNIFLILCGSAVSFIAKEVLGEKNPLYGRARTIMKVRPLPFQTTGLQCRRSLSGLRCVGRHPVLLAWNESAALHDRKPCKQHPEDKRFSQ